MKIAVLDLTTPFSGMEGRPTAGAMIVSWLAPAMPEAELTVVDVAGGAAIPAVGDFDGYVLSGSEKGVYDQTDWMLNLRRFLLEARDAGKGLVGICFGHQLMADTFGGKAEKLDLGNIVGARPFVIDGVEFDTHVWHQDQVTQLPPQAHVAGGADYCPLGVLRYDFPAYSVQFHPEYTRAFLEDEINIITGSYMTAEAAAAAFASLAAANVPADLVARECAETLRMARVANDYLPDGLSFGDNLRLPETLNLAAVP